MLGWQLVVKGRGSKRIGFAGGAVHISLVSIEVNDQMKNSGLSLDYMLNIVE